MLLKKLDREDFERQVESVHNRYVEGLNCAERVFLSLHSLLQADIPSEAVALLSGFGGGVGLTRDGMCGAVSGGIAGIGLIYGRRKPPMGSRERVYEVSRDFLCRFKSRFGTTLCRDLIGDLLRESTPQSEEKRKERCLQYTLNAAKLCIDTLMKYEKMYALESNL